MPASHPAYRRVMLKLSGDSFGSGHEGGIDMTAVGHMADAIKEVVDTGVQLLVVCGGGNILRGKSFSAGVEIDEAQAHYMGMLATVINALALQDSLRQRNVEVRTQSAIPMDNICEPFIRMRCIRHLEKGRVVICAAGTGRPYVTTDTAAALTAREVNANIVLKATRVDGIYSEDPEKNPHAVRYDKLSFDEAIDRKLKVMDSQAFGHCQEAGIPILVFDFNREGNIMRAVMGEPVGTIVGSGPTADDGSVPPH